MIAGIGADSAVQNVKKPAKIGPDAQLPALDRDAALAGIPVLISCAPW
jgi:hypothetical protein